MTFLEHSLKTCKMTINSGKTVEKSLNWYNFTQNNSDSLVRNSLVFSFYKIKGYTKGKCKFYGYVDVSILKSCVRNVTGFKLIINQKSDNDVTIYRLDVMMSIFFSTLLCLLSSLVIGPSFMPISSLVLELQQFLIIRD